MSPSLVRKIGYAAFFALVAIVLAGYIFFPRGYKPRERSLLPKNSEERIARIEILRQGDPYAVLLNRIDGAWKIAIDQTHEYPARPEKISALMHALLQKRTLIPVGSIAEENAGIGTDGSYTLRVFVDAGSRNGEKSAILRFGNTDATGKWMYAKQEPDSRIFRTESDMEVFLDVRAASWAKLAIFSETLSKTGIQRVVFTKSGSVRQVLAGKDKAIGTFESALARMECLDVTNLKSNETEFLDVEFGDLKTVRIGLAPLGDVWILSDSESGGAYIISDETKRGLEEALGAD